MSVYIADLEMPKKYPVTVTIFPDGIAVAKTISGRRFTATAVSVPSYLRLLWDRHVIETFGDAIIAEAEKTGKVRATFDEIASVVADVPSIIQEGEKAL